MIAWVSDSSSNTQTGGFHVTTRVGLLAEALEHSTVQEALQKHKDRGRRESQLDHSSEALLNEIDELIGKPYFNQYDPELSFQKLDLSKGYTSIEKYAPTWADFFHYL